MKERSLAAPSFTPATAGEPTIAAIATALGAAGVAVIRVSGSQAWAMVDACFSRCLEGAESHKALFGSITDASGGLLDQVLVLPFQAPRSFTGEDVVEIQGHGGQVLPLRVLNRLLELGCQPAARGEFSKRAFLNGKLDLSQAESLLEAIHAEGEALATVALHNLKSQTLARYLSTLQTKLSQLQATIVAAVDYPEEVEEPPREQLLQQLTALRTEALGLAATNQQHQLYQEGLKLAILGRPNAGKSSLFNHLLASDRSIVTAVAGTTRDVLQERLLLKGIPITLLDTAGIRASEDEVEQLGVERSLHAAQEADLLLYLLDASSYLAGCDLQKGLPPLPEADAHLLASLPQRTPCLLLFNKLDALAPATQALFQTALKQAPTLFGRPALSASIQTSVGLDALPDALLALLPALSEASALQEARLCLNKRQSACLQAMAQHIRLAEETLAEPCYPLDLLTIPLSDALYELDALLGIDSTEAMLDVVFSQFCVGK